MLQRSIAKKRAGEGGFTLIELLIVIVILGILAAIVVLAIGGLSGSSQKSACNADANTIKVAEDAYYAAPSTADPNVANQKYADEATLVSEKLLKKNSSNWDVAVTGGGTGYSGTVATGAKCTGTFNEAS